MIGKLAVLFAGTFCVLLSGCAMTTVVRLPKDHAITKDSAIRAIGDWVNEVSKRDYPANRDYFYGEKSVSQETLLSVTGADGSGWRMLETLRPMEPRPGELVFTQRSLIEVKTPYYRDIDRIEWASCPLVALGVSWFVNPCILSEGHVIMKDGSAFTVSSPFRSERFSYNAFFPLYFLNIGGPLRYKEDVLFSLLYMKDMATEGRKEAERARNPVPIDTASPSAK